jgi:hypothetical protein
MKRSNIKKLKTAEKKLLSSTAGYVLLVHRRDPNILVKLDVYSA